MELLFTFSGIFILGFIGGSIPGPILTSTFTEVLREGFKKSLKIIIYAAISEIIVASIILFLLFSLNIPQGVFYVISFIGVAVLFWMASQIWKIKELHDKGKIFDFKKIFLLTAFNGPLWIFWSTICVPQAYILSQKISGGQIVFLILFEMGWMVSTTGLVYLFSHFRKYLIKGKFIGIVFKIFAAILGIFAVKMVIDSISYFLK